MGDSDSNSETPPAPRPSETFVTVQRWTDQAVWDHQQIAALQVAVSDLRDQISLIHTSLEALRRDRVSALQGLGLPPQEWADTNLLSRVVSLLRDLAGKVRYLWLHYGAPLPSAVPVEDP